jgi:hypothetical protein
MCNDVNPVSRTILNRNDVREAILAQEASCNVFPDIADFLIRQLSEILTPQRREQIHCSDWGIIQMFRGIGNRIVEFTLEQITTTIKEVSDPRAAGRNKRQGYEARDDDLLPG